MPPSKMTRLPIPPRAYVTNISSPREKVSTSTLQPHSTRGSNSVPFLPCPRDASIQPLIDHVLERYVILRSYHPYTPLPSLPCPCRALPSRIRAILWPCPKATAIPSKAITPNKSTLWRIRVVHSITSTFMRWHFLRPNYLMTSYHTVNIEPGSVEQSIHTADELVVLPRPRPLRLIMRVVSSIGWINLGVTGANDLVNIGHDCVSRWIHGGERCYDSHTRFTCLGRWPRPYTPGNDNCNHACWLDVLPPEHSMA